MSHPRLTVIAGPVYDDRLAELWFADPETVESVSNTLDTVLRTIPDQAGQSFEFEGKRYRYLRLLGYQVVYEIKLQDCQVVLHDIRPV